MSNEASTSSLGFAAFLVMEGFEMVTPPVKGGKKFKFDFKMEAEHMTDMYQKYAISKFHNFDTIVQTIRRSLRDENSNVSPG